MAVTQFFPLFSGLDTAKGGTSATETRRIPVSAPYEVLLSRIPRCSQESTSVIENAFTSLTEFRNECSLTINGTPATIIAGITPTASGEVAFQILQGDQWRFSPKVTFHSSDAGKTAVFTYSGFMSNADSRYLEQIRDAVNRLETLPPCGLLSLNTYDAGAFLNGTANGKGLYITPSRGALKTTAGMQVWTGGFCDFSTGDTQVSAFSDVDGYKSLSVYLYDNAGTLTLAIAENAETSTKPTTPTVTEREDGGWLCGAVIVQGDGTGNAGGILPIAQTDCLSLWNVAGGGETVDVSTKEDVANKRTSWQATPTDTAYPSEKLVKDALDGKASSSHPHVKADVSDFAHQHVKADVTDFTHQHVKADVSDFAHTHAYADITNNPATLITADTIYYVATTGSDTTGDGSVTTPWATPAKALSALGNYRVQEGKTLTIQCDDGTYTFSSPISNLPKGFLLTGKNTYTKTMSSVQSSSGSAGARSVVINLNNVTNITTSDFAIISAASGGTNPKYIEGCWDITAVDAVNNRITVATTHRGASAPASTVSATVTIIKTIFSFTGVSGISLTAMMGGSISKCVLQGDNTASTDGVQSSTGAVITLINPIGIRNFGRYGLYAFNAGVIKSDGGAVSANGNTGIVAEIGYAILGAIITTGNAWNGILSRGGRIAAPSCVCSGNAVAGLVVQHQGTLLASSAVVNANTTYDIYASTYGYILANGATIAGSTSPAVNTQGNEYGYIDT